jgi:hypothetical protein
MVLDTLISKNQRATTEPRSTCGGFCGRPVNFTEPALIAGSFFNCQTTASHKPYYAVDATPRLFKAVLPYSQHLPTILLQGSIYQAIPGFVGSELLLPELTIVYREI